MKISDVARAAGVSVETIRFYQDRGLVRKPDKPSQGFRRYSKHTVNRIQFILRAKSLGFSLDEILEILEIDSELCHKTKKIAEDKLQHIKQKIKDLRLMGECLESLIQESEDNNSDSEYCPIINKLKIGSNDEDDKCYKALKD